MGRPRNAVSGYDEIYAVVRRIPRGRVATYGQIARLAGRPGAARQVGYALSALHEPARPVPWHRVVNAQGRISGRSPDHPERDPEREQRARLEAEGVEFSATGVIDLKRFQWRPRGTVE